MRAYMVYAEGYQEEEAVLVYAKTSSQARSIGRKYLMEPPKWQYVQAKRIPSVDNHPDRLDTAGYVSIKKAKLYRDAGFSCDGDGHCSCCDLATMDGEFPLCEECFACEKCGCDDDCPMKGGE